MSFESLERIDGCWNAIRYGRVEMKFMTNSPTSKQKLQSTELQFIGLWNKRRKHAIQRMTNAVNSEMR